jgi:anti-sigma regulatory factor (Ser/Thr protein kinase)
VAARAGRGDVMIIPKDLAGAPGVAWPMSSVLPPMGALTSAPGTARAHVRAVLAGWGLAELTEDCELVLSELATNAVEASTGPTGRLLYVNGRMPVVRVCLFSDGVRLLIEVWDQAMGFPALRRPASDAEAGRGLHLVDALTGGRWGWQPGHGPAKVVWAELISELADPEHDKVLMGLGNRPAGDAERPAGPGTLRVRGSPATGPLVPGRGGARPALARGPGRRPTPDLGLLPHDNGATASRT